MMERGYEGVVGGNYGYENGVVMTRDPKPRLRWTADLHDRFVDAVTKLGGPDIGNNQTEEIPIAEALRRQIEVQKRLEEQLEVQKKLQMRIEAQGKYLQAMLEKAQMSLSLDMNGPNSLEEAGVQLTDINSALSNFMDNMNRDTKENIMDMNDFYKTTHDSSTAFGIYGGEEEDHKDEKPKVEEGSKQFDLNIKDSYDFVPVGAAEMDSKMLSACRV